MPHRNFSLASEFHKEFNDISELLVDVTERPIQRPISATKQTEHHSGKQKDHTVKNTVIANLDTTILYLGPTLPGNQHDYGLFKQEFDPNQEWFQPFKLWADLGYKGFDKDYEKSKLHLPNRLPRKTNSNPSLTLAQRLENQTIKRIRIEHSLSGLKRFNIRF